MKLTFYVYPCPFAYMSTTITTERVQQKVIQPVNTSSGAFGGHSDDSETQLLSPEAISGKTHELPPSISSTQNMPPLLMHSTQELSWTKQLVKFKQSAPLQAQRSADWQLISTGHQRAEAFNDVHTVHDDTTDPNTTGALTTANSCSSTTNRFVSITHASAPNTGTPFDCV
uniref:Uncharacterized protein n=1 Tax=Trypanosoma congolense (strain IL3000) TaxID=1068625 RepID=G0UQD7_TRYCI|nr:hypothetical protein TCIL3000_7_4120 [Trypanosoma congolense IL3000]